MEVLIILALFGLIIGVVAQQKGRSFFPWFVYGAILFIIAFIHVLVIKDTSGKKCSKCLSAVPEEATVCKYCQHKFTAEEFKEINEKKEKVQKHNRKILIVLAILCVIAFVLFKVGFSGNY